jgi:hypothetical protein
MYSKRFGEPAPASKPITKMNCSTERVTLSRKHHVMLTIKLNALEEAEEILEQKRRRGRRGRN